MEQEHKAFLLRAFLFFCIISPCLCCCGPNLCALSGRNAPKTTVTTFNTPTPPTRTPVAPEPIQPESTSIEQEQENAPLSDPTATPEALWETVGRWTGSHRQNTESFTVQSHTWRIRWRITAPDPDVVEFDGVVRNEDGSVFETISGTQTEALLSSHMRGAGTYYLELSIANGEYEVFVEEMR